MSRFALVVLALLACSRPAVTFGEPPMPKVSQLEMKDFEIADLKIQAAVMKLNAEIAPFVKTKTDIIAKYKLIEGDHWQPDGTIVRAPKAPPAKPAPVAKVEAKPAPTPKPEDKKK